MSIFTRTAIIFASFAVMAHVLLLAGKPENPAFLELAANGDEQFDVAILGDSRPHTGISPAELEKVLEAKSGRGIKVYNYGVDGTDAIHQVMFAVNGLLNSAKPPRLILWAPNPLQFNEKRTHNRLDYLHPSDVAPLIEARAPFELVLDVATMGFFLPWKERPLVASILSDYSERAGIRTLPFQKKILGLQDPRAIKESESRHYSKRERGFEPFEVLNWHDRFERGARTYQADYDSLKLSDWHFELLQQLLKKAAAKKVTVALVEMPVSPWFQKNLSTSEKHQRWRKKIASLAAQKGVVFFNHSDFVQEDDRQFGDPGHMPLGLALKYSRFLAEQISSNVELISVLKAWRR